MEKRLSLVEQRLLIILLFSFLCFSSLNSYATQKASFTGVWKGNGSIRVDGVPKKAECHIRNTHKSGNQYYTVISCTLVDLGRGKTTIVVNKVGSASYSGTLTDEYSEEKVRLSARQTGYKMKVNVRSKRLKGVINLNRIK